MTQLKGPDRRSALAPWLMLLIPVIVYGAHATVFRGWLIDDAGITFSYARNLAHGYGLVAQPGAPRVEAYSNFLWLLLETPFFLLRIFEPYLTLKLLAAALVFASFGITYRTLRPALPAAGIAVILALAALSTPFVAWTTSGLENPLYVFLACLLLAGLVRVIRAEAGWLLAAGLGALAAGLGMTRPDGLVFFAAYGAALVAGLLYRDRRRLTRRDGRGLIAYAAAFALVYGGFLAFRLAYFGEMFPNTYAAKGGPSLASLVALLTVQPEMVAKLFDLFASVTGHGLAGLAALALFAATLFLAFTRRLRSEHLAVLIVLACATAIYLLLPADGMGEYRFGTNFVLFVYLYGGMVAWETLTALKLERVRLIAAAGGLAALALIGSAALYAGRSAHFVRYPPIPFADISAEYGRRYDDYATALGIPADQASVLLPDLGGTLYNSDVHIYDLGMLADKTIARTLKRDKPGFYDYVFEQVRPTFIHTHDTWTYLARLDDDPRFRRDYTPIYEYDDAWAQKRHGLTLRSGDYVRKDVLTDGNAAALANLRAASAPRTGFNQALYLAVAGDAAAAGQAYTQARAAATADDLRRAIRDIEAFLLIYPGDPPAAALRDRLAAELKTER